MESPVHGTMCPHIIQCQVLKAGLLSIHSAELLERPDILPRGVQMGENGVMIGKQDNKRVAQVMCFLPQCLPLLHAFSRTIIEMADKKRHRKTIEMFQHNTQ